MVTHTLPANGPQIKTSGDLLISIAQQIGKCYPKMGTVAAMDFAARVMRPRPYSEWTPRMKSTYAQALQLHSLEPA